MWAIIITPLVIIGMIGLLLYIFLWGYFPGVPGVFSNDKVADSFNRVKNEFKIRQIEPSSVLKDEKMFESKKIEIEKPKIEGNNKF
jgi:hypothetical protein